MRLEPIYRATFSTPESWSVEVAGEHGLETQGFLIAEGRTEGRINARYRGANAPRRRVDGVLMPDFRGVLETVDGATIMFAWSGFTRPSADGSARRLVGSATHLSDDERYRWLNAVVGAVAGEVRPRHDGTGFDVVIEVGELVWEPLAR